MNKWTSKYKKKMCVLNNTKWQIKTQIKPRKTTQNNKEIKWHSERIKNKWEVWKIRMFKKITIKQVVLYTQIYYSKLIIK